MIYQYIYIYIYIIKIFVNLATWLNLIRGTYGLIPNYELYHMWVLNSIYTISLTPSKNVPYAWDVYNYASFLLQHVFHTTMLHSLSL